MRNIAHLTTLSLQMPDRNSVELEGTDREEMVILIDEMRVLSTTRQPDFVSLAQVNGFSREMPCDCFNVLGTWLMKTASMRS